MNKVKSNWDKLLRNSTYGVFGKSQNEYERFLNTIKKMKRSEKIKEFLKSI